MIRGRLGATTSSTSVPSLLEIAPHFLFLTGLPKTLILELTYLVLEPAHLHLGSPLRIVELSELNIDIPHKVPNYLLKAVDAFVSDSHNRQKIGSIPILL